MTYEGLGEMFEGDSADIGPSVLRAPAEQTKVATIFGN